MTDLLVATKSFESLTAILAMLAALFAGISAWLSYTLARKIRDELKADEALLAGVLHNPELVNINHSEAVLQTTLFNKAKRKTYVHQVIARDDRGEKIDIDWSDRINAFGMPQGSAQLIGIVDSAQLCVRRRDGMAFHDAAVEVSHSFANSPLVLRYSVDPGWQAYFTK